MIVQWTNVCREDRYVPEHESGPWITPGNIYSQNVYDDRFVKDYFSELGAYVRDLAFIKATHKIISNKTQCHFLQMVDIMDKPDQWSNQSCDISQLSTMTDVTQDIMPSFYKILYDNDVQNKFKKDHNLINKDFYDGHPTPIEHFTYLKTLFDYTFKQSTVNAVEQAQIKWVTELRSSAVNKKNWRIFDMDQSWRKRLYNNTIIKTGDDIDDKISTLNGIS